MSKGKTKPKYSICIINFNNASTLAVSVESIITQINDEYEIVVVDSRSTDGSVKILEDYATKGRISLILRKCCRGVGRQIAFENSAGEYIIADLDTDDIFRHELSDLVSLYHTRCEGKLLLATTDKNRWASNVTVGPRSLIQRLGGWRNLQWGEDWDLWRRASREGSFRWTTFQLVDRINTHPERSRPSVRLRQRYERYRDWLRLGRPIFSLGEQRTVVQRATAWAAGISAYFHTSYDDGQGPFDPYDPAQFIARSDAP